MKVLLTRFGGIGDCFPTVAAGEYLASIGNEVSVGLRFDGKLSQPSMFKDSQTVNVFDLKECGPWHDRCIKTEIGWKSVQSEYGNFDTVIDFMNIVENNSTSPHNNTKDLWEVWQRSRNSNYTNWYDLHLDWCNVDHTKVGDEFKRPHLSLTEAEKVKSKELKDRYPTLFVIHPFASSLARSWYQAKDLVPLLLKTYPSCAIAFWDPHSSNWDLLTAKGPSKLKKLDENPLRETMILVSAASLVVSVDTGCAHIAEGLNVKSLVIYSTVPAWTRNKYYKYQSYIDPGENNPEFYTFSLSLGDPLRVKDGFANISEREKRIQELYDAHADISDVMKELNTDAQGAELELRMLMNKREALERQQSKALSSVSVEQVFNKIKELV